MLRATAKLHKFFELDPVSSLSTETALGDWYVNRVHLGRQPVLLLICSRTFLPIVIPAKDVRSLPVRLPELVQKRLGRLPIEPSLIEAEVAAMKTVRVSKTEDRSVLGILNEFAKSMKLIRMYYYPDRTIEELEQSLGETPCTVKTRPKEWIIPNLTTCEVLRDRWQSTVMSEWS